MQPPPADAGALAQAWWNQLFFVLLAALALAWLICLLLLCRHCRVVVDEHGVSVLAFGRRADEAAPSYDHAGMRSARTASFLGWRWLRIQHDRGVLRLARALFPSEDAFTEFSQALTAQARRVQAARGDGARNRPAAPKPARRPGRWWRRISVAAGLTALAAALWWAAQAWLPSAASFDHAMRQVWEARHPGRGAVAGFDGKGVPVCLSLAPRPGPYARSHHWEGLAWHEDYLDEASGAGAPVPAVRRQQLEALAQAGLVERLPVSLLVNGVPSPATRYRLSSQGWAAQSWRRACFMLGVQRYLGVTGWQLVRPISNLNRHYYTVRARVGMHEADLPAWARHPAVQAAFPDLPKLWQPREISLPLVRQWRGWTGPKSRRSAAAVPVAQAWQERWQQAWAWVRARFHAMVHAVREGGHPMPEPAEIEHVVRAMHVASSSSADVQSCLYLPGHASSLPVDAVLHSGPAPRYAVAVNLQKQNTEHDPVTRKTLPYLRQLEAAGVLVRGERRMVVAQRGRSKGRAFLADVYELAPAMRHAQHLSEAECLPLGKPTLEFVSVQMAPADSVHKLHPQFRYKLRVLYPTPPDWATRPDLQSAWPDLREALARGRECQGQFAYDLASSEAEAGGGWCRWAFDSVLR
ncbi:hypothetical protein EII20_13120 [Comamonadaceae bacterium OH2545_COT-014]|nr:hypothetical protein EII20_13120 [Comamonadaceae bacterium OH2545_COT-014]